MYSYKFKIGDYLVERYKGRHNINLVVVTKIDEINNLYTMKILKSNKAYTFKGLVTFDFNYVESGYKRIELTDDKLLAMVL